VDAIEQGDGELAEILMRRHISNAKEMLISQLDQIDKVNN
jgi:DNA-binding GntR family transcriptional regulator